MSDEKAAQSAKAAWRAQHLEVPTMSYLRLRALEHERYARTRSLAECAAAIGGLVAAAVFFATIDSLLLRLGLVVCAAGGLYWLGQWRRRRATYSDLSRTGADDALTFYKRELTQLRDAHRVLWKTHLLAALPGALLLSVWLLLDAGAPFTERWWRAATIPIAVAAWIGSMIWHELQKANEYQRELEALEPRAE